MMHPDDEANTDAPLVPDLRAPNRPTTPERRDADSIRQELRELRSRIDYLEAYLAAGTDR